MSNERNNIHDEINDGKNDININDFTNPLNDKLADISKHNEDKKNLSNTNDKERKVQD